MVYGETALKPLYPPGYASKIVLNIFYNVPTSFLLAVKQLRLLFKAVMVQISQKFQIVISFSTVQWILSLDVLGGPLYSAPIVLKNAKKF